MKSLSRTPVLLKTLCDLTMLVKQVKESKDGLRGMALRFVILFVICDHRDSDHSHDYYHDYNM